MFNMFSGSICNIVLFAISSILTILANSVICRIDTGKPYYDANKFVGKWYVVARLHPHYLTSMPCMQMFVTKDENNTFTIFVSGVCRRYCNETSTATIVHSTIHELTNDNRKPSNILILNDPRTDDIALYNLQSRDSYLLSRTNKISRTYIKILWHYARAGWKFYCTPYEGCE